MKHIVLLLIGLISTAPCFSQGLLPSSYIGMPVTAPLPIGSGDNSAKLKKWSLVKYGGIETGIVGFRGGSATYFAAPVGLQLNRRITNNIYAFAGVNVAPTYINFNQAFLNSSVQKPFGNSMMYQQNGFNMNSRASLGLMYTNDERTFQISGSIGVERRQFPQANDFYRMNRQMSGSPIVR